MKTPTFKSTLRLTLATAGILLPLLAFAAPQNVTGIMANLENGGVRVNWNKVNDPDIASYRVFFSHQSILDNNGLYDDFETVQGNVTTHLLQSLPPASEIFVTVLAVNQKGEESPYFTQEARVSMSAAPASAASSSSMSVSMPAVGNELRLLGAEAISSTGVLLRFTHPVNIPSDQALSAILIERQSGSVLAMRRYVIEGNNVIVHTAPQQSGQPYRVTISSIVTGKKSDGTSAPLASDQTPVLFMALGMGGNSSSVTISPARAEVMQLRLRAEPETSGKYAVEATWQAPSAPVTSYSIAQTTDGGRTYSTPRVVNKDTRGVKINGVPAGTKLGVLVKTMYADGTQSQGVAQMITLPGTSTLPGSVTDTPTPGKLPSSGPSIYIALMAIAAIAGVWTVKQRELRTAKA